jgi:hypothetical protein
MIGREHCIRLALQRVQWGRVALPWSDQVKCVPILLVDRIELLRTIVRICRLEQGEIVECEISAKGFERRLGANLILVVLVAVAAGWGRTAPLD